MEKNDQKIEYEKTPIKNLPQNEFAEAERSAIKLMQNESFKEELELLRKGKKIKNDSKYWSDNLYLDKHKIIRTKGRLNDTSFEKINTPVLFQHKHPLTLLYIQFKHKCYNCSSVDYTLNIIRREIHSLKLRLQRTRQGFIYS